MSVLQGAIDVPSPGSDSGDVTTIPFACHHCRQPLEAESDMAGDGQCPSCQNIITVP